MDKDDVDLSAVLHALSDPQRRGMVAELANAEEPRPCGSFAPGITKSTRTHHFRVLREAGLVGQGEEGTSKMRRLGREDIDPRTPGLPEPAPRAASPGGTSGGDRSRSRPSSARDRGAALSARFQRQSRRSDAA